MPQGGEVVVLIDHGHAVGAEAREDLALGARHPLHGPEAFEVGRGAAGHHGHRRLCDAAQAGDLAGVVGAHLHDRVAVRVVEGEEAEGHTDLVVQIAAGRGRGAGPGQDRQEHLLDRGLAVAARDRDQGDRKARPPQRRERTQRRQGVGHHEEREGGRDRPLHDGRGRAAFLGLGHELVAVVMRPAQGHEQLAGAEGAAVRATAREGHIGARYAPRQQAGEVRQTPADHDVPPPAIAATMRRTTSRSLNGRRCPAIS